MRTAALLGVAALVLAVPTTAAPTTAAPAIPTPDFLAAEANNFVASTGRAQAWLSDPDFLASPAAFDPARAVDRWAAAGRGRTRVVSWRNRYDVHISGRLYAPPRGSGPFPTVVFVPGAGVSKDAYHWVGEDLAEHGYVVLAFDPQGQGASGATPPARFCRPGEWQRRQELGMRETGSCAGQDPMSSAVTSNTEQVEFIAQARTGRVDPGVIAGTYRTLAPRFVLGALDAVRWLTSTADPWRRLVARDRLGIVGHSIGAYAANLVGNGDPRRRFRASVAMDAFYANDRGVRPRVPTLMMQSEQETLIGPHAAPVGSPRSPRTLHPTRATWRQFLDSPVDAAFLVPAASNHNDFTDALQPASFLGQRTAAVAMGAWLDRYVAGRRAGLAPLLRGRPGDLVDASSIGTGQPILGDRLWTELLSMHYPTEISVGGVVSELSSTPFFSGRRSISRQRGSTAGSIVTTK